MYILYYTTCMAGLLFNMALDDIRLLSDTLFFFERITATQYSIAQGFFLLQHCANMCRNSTEGVFSACLVCVFFLHSSFFTRMIIGIVPLRSATTKWRFHH